jgi:hypothetical protein
MVVIITDLEIHIITIGITTTGITTIVDMAEDLLIIIFTLEII